ncbi:hypothetical protein P872_19600 [Rhodonellum psychrophilum GCM71 = DSM 17998]|uniref:Uncharacterized protein n=2 Tax=Rhodonellum TaxID=336827 RepID=U5BVW8_9BACT|nr:hypothetical protein P872_19600 [Rhodonellum psychrophilum GCM71 = DSM 17998]SDY83611.1 hypothetical protein SAMN05444412_10386 [Rhodonellum ikkaensis]
MLKSVNVISFLKILVRNEFQLLLIFAHQKTRILSRTRIESAKSKSERVGFFIFGI